MPDSPQAPDPIAVADDICEILFHEDAGSQLSRLAALVTEAGASFDATLAELADRDGISKLLPRAHSTEAASLQAAMVAGVNTAEGATLLAGALVDRSLDCDRAMLASLIARANQRGILPALFASIIEGARYERLCTLLLSDGTTDSAALRALAAARPDYGREALNRPALLELRGSATTARKYDLLIVPGYTPVDAAAPIALDDLPPARQRLTLALQQFESGVAPFFFLTGGSVHPPGTPLNEALMMRTFLLAQGVPENRILVDPHARHSTTNIRNAGRLILAEKRTSALIVTGFERSIFAQDFYFSHDTLSTFDARCKKTLGHSVGTLSGVADHLIAYTPVPEVATPNWQDPLDW